MGVTWTEDQRRVIEARGENILVSAAAGSGKTAVLVERIMGLILDRQNPADVDELLVVTFTRAAAEEMRERIRRALENALKRSPRDARLMKQLSLIHTASITTIDSFCMQVIRSHYEEADLDPSFRVGEEGELQLMRQDVLGELLEDCYREGSPAFSSFTDCYAPGRNDGALERMILRLYEFAQSYPWPQEWLRSCLKAYGNAAGKKGGWQEPGGKGQKADGESGEADGESREVDRESREADGESGQEPGWLAWLVESLKASIRSFRESAQLAAEEARSPGGPYMYEEALQEDIRSFREMEEAEGFAGLARQIGAYRPVSLSRKKDETVSEEKRASVRARRDGYKKELDQLRKRYFFQELEEYQEYMARCRQPAETLISLTEEFGRRFREKKRENNLVDFSDLEHECLEIFLRKEGGRRVPTETALSYARMYREIFIDEYQDSNLVQEILLNSIAGRGDGSRNLFMVGDVKQSIYSFRLARPALFLEKYHAYRRLEEGGAGEKGTYPGVCIGLRQNFRSRREVLEGINGIFRQAMGEDLGRYRL